MHGYIYIYTHIDYRAYLFEICKRGGTRGGKPEETLSVLSDVFLGRKSYDLE